MKWEVGGTKSLRKKVVDTDYTERLGTDSIEKKANIEPTCR